MRRLVTRHPLRSYFVLAFGIAFYTWIYNGTGGSLLLAVLYHDVFNTSAVFIPARPSEWPGIAVTAGVAAVVILSRKSAWFGPAPARAMRSAQG